MSDDEVTVTQGVAPDNGISRLNIGIPTGLMQRLEQECSNRMVGKPLIVTLALEMLFDELPPAV